MPITLSPGEARQLNVQLTPHELPEPTVVVFEASKDTWIDAGNPDINYGYDSGMYIGWPGTAADGRLARALIQFSPQWGLDIPSGATIVNAVIELHVLSKVGHRQTLNIQRLLRRDWVEGSATWNRYRQGVSWGLPGASCSTSDYTTVDAYGTHVDPGDTRIIFGRHDGVTARLRNQIQWAQANNADVAFRIYDIFEDFGVHVSVGTKEHQGPSFHPRLYVTYQ